MTKIFLKCLLIILLVVLVCLMTSNATSIHHNQLVATRGVANYRCIDKERVALLDFKSHLQDPIGRLSTWRDEDDCCKWRGVTCNNQTGHVTELDLGFGILKGMISPSLLNLSYLTHLDLRWNRFSENIPRFIGSMTRLTYLDLSVNPFIVENIDWLSDLSRLQYLNMGNISLAKANNWVNVILGLEELSYLSLWGCNLSQVMHPYSSSLNSSLSSSSIETIYLGRNNLNSSMYRWLFPLTSNNLQYLHLVDNMLDMIPKYLGNLCRLTSLFLSNNSIAISFSELVNNLSGCTSVTLQVLYAATNQLTGSLSDEIQNFSSLRELNLGYNHLNGNISEKVFELPNLETVYVSFNSLKGVVFENRGKSKLRYMDLSNNSVQVVHMSNLSHVEGIVLTSCKLGPSFPKWIQTLKNLTHLNIANTGISDQISEDFWSTWPSRLSYMNLSSNNITGKVPDLLSNFDPRSSVIDLSSNNFYGRIPNVPSTLEKLYLSRNKFDGGISFLCHIVGGLLTFLDLSHNSFTGQIPDCLWHFKQLRVLNLGHNNLSGRLPASMEYLVELEVLYLYNNGFSGDLPLSIRNCTKLNFMDLGANGFSGNVPVWIGESLSELYILSLRSNQFVGHITLQLCQLAHLQILDLSMNNLYGTIPSCINNLTSMIQENLLLPKIEHFYTESWDHLAEGFLDYVNDNYVDHTMINWQGSVREFSSTLGLVKTIDLSRNNLSGQIPDELTDLHGLLALNLSHNALLGNIPSKTGEMRNLLALDLSRNNLSGSIPSSMAQMSYLNYFDVSYNNLSGRVPYSTQLQSFEPMWFAGNTGLCGPPVTKKCPEDEGLQVPQSFPASKGGGEVEEELERWYYIGGATGFATGFSIICSSLLVNQRGRHVFFGFLDCLKDWVYVKVMVFLARLQRVARR